MTGVRPVALGDGAWEPVNAQIGRQVVHGAAMTCTRYRFGPGGIFPAHQHPQEQLTYVIAGRMTFTLPDGNHDIDADALVVIPPGVPHRGRAGPEGAEVLCVVSPTRTTATGIEFVR